jgi:hypothetical protein
VTAPAMRSSTKLLGWAGTSRGPFPCWVLPGGQQAFELPPISRMPLGSAAAVACPAAARCLHARLLALCASLWQQSGPHVRDSMKQNAVLLP